jgi:hypothetical protein
MADNKVQRYREALKSPDINISREAAKVLGEIGPAAKDAVTALVEALNDDNIDLIAVWALGQIGPAAIAAAPAIRRWLEKMRSSCRPLSLIQGQLPYLPEDERGRFHSNNIGNKGQVQVSQYG